MNDFRIEMDEVTVGSDPASGPDYPTIVTGSIDRRMAAETMPDILLTGEIKRPSEVKAMANFLNPLCPPAPNKSARQQRSEARRARHAARPPTKGYWAKRLAGTWVVNVTGIDIVREGDDLVCRPYNGNDYRPTGAEDRRAALNLLRQRSGGGVSIRWDPNSSLNCPVDSPTETP